MSLHVLLCVCHIITFFNAQKSFCEFCGLFNIRYVEKTHSFANAQQVVTYLVCIIATFSILFCYIFRESMNTDRYTFQLYVLTGLVFLISRPYLLDVLNQMIQVHRFLEMALGELMCTSVVRASIWAYVFTGELIMILYWQLSTYNAMGRCLLFFVLLFHYLQMMLHVNCYLWLTCLHVAMNRVFTELLTYKQRLKMLRLVLCAQPSLRRIEEAMQKYFNYYITMSLVEIRYVSNQLVLLATLLLVAREFSKERRLFEQNLWLLINKPHDFYRRLQDYKFFKPYIKRLDRRLDIVDFMVCISATH
ncbi:uncharacterized protein LOC115622447 [Scaptodrosophila lebanonensis]|uniref:Uncharacterized protein LOC115622447 n=1 Tax=Drosophila lebanonensis TaxID=7225 RepID=A0A6J2TAW6_DROLE|nr:uncharacterized protein LOC115622447 [Scaptodrosophila lebanonensis]